MAKISIAMTTYNGENYVEKQLLSLLEQTKQADDVVICDDHSTDHTAEIVSAFIREHGLRHWSFSVNEENIGFKRNFHQAISRTSGELIILCDQDDIWYPHKISAMEEIFIKHSEIKALNTGFDFIDECGRPFYIRKKRGKSNHNLIKMKIEKDALVNIDFSTILAYNISPGCTMAFREEVKCIYLRESDCGMVHDWELNFISAFCERGLYFWNLPTIRYRIHEKNTVGLDVKLDIFNLLKRGRYEVRLRIAKIMHDDALAFEKYFPYLRPVDCVTLRKQIDFFSLRKEALEKKSFREILFLYKYRENYLRAVTWKGRIADILCVLH